MAVARIGVHPDRPRVEHHDRLVVREPDVAGVGQGAEARRLQIDDVAGRRGLAHPGIVEHHGLAVAEAQRHQRGLGRGQRRADLPALSGAPEGQGVEDPQALDGQGLVHGGAFQLDPVMAEFPPQQGRHGLSEQPLDRWRPAFGAQRIERQGGQVALKVVQPKLGFQVLLDEGDVQAKEGFQPPPVVRLPQFGGDDRQGRGQGQAPLGGAVGMPELLEMPGLAEVGDPQEAVGELRPQRQGRLREPFGGRAEIAHEAEVRPPELVVAVVRLHRPVDRVRGAEIDGLVEEGEPAGEAALRVLGVLGAEECRGDLHRDPDRLARREARQGVGPRLQPVAVGLGREAYGLVAQPTGGMPPHRLRREVGGGPDGGRHVLQTRHLIPCAPTGALVNSST